MNYQEYLCHFNKNHDPRNGQFAPGKGVVGALQKLGYRQANSKSGQLGMKIGKSPRTKKVIKISSAAGVTAAGATAASMILFNKDLQTMYPNVFQFSPNAIANTAIHNAGKVAIAAGLVTIGAMKIHDFRKKRREPKVRK